MTTPVIPRLRPTITTEEGTPVVTEPTASLERLPGWKLRLLERIQNTGADHHRVLTMGYPDYHPDHGSGDIRIQIWRTHLHTLDSDRAELERYAAAAGVPIVAIRQARAAGQRGVRWEDSVLSPRVSGHGEDPVRAHMIEDIAADIWTLEHMAAVNVEHTIRGADGRFPHHRDAEAQFDRNMVALWHRADDTAQILGLPTRERSDLWDRDRSGWQRLTAVTVRTYNDTALHERWRGFAWPGIEHEALRSLDNLAVRHPIPHRGPEPPTPRQLLERADEALSTLAHRSDATGAGRDFDAVVEAFSPRDLVVSWADDTAATADPELGDHPSGPEM